MRRSSAAPIALVLMLSALAVALVPIHPAAADLAGPDSATNVDYTTYPGDIVLSTTSGASTFLTVQPDPAAGLDAYLDRGSVTLNHGGDTTLIYEARGSTNRRPI